LLAFLSLNISIPECIPSKMNLSIAGGGRVRNVSLKDDQDQRLKN